MKWYLIAKLTLIAGATVDTTSSWNRPELNPLLSAHHAAFSYGALSIKAGMLAGQFIGQHELQKHHMLSEHNAALLNFSEGVALGAVAARNWRQ